MFPSDPLPPPHGGVLVERTLAGQAAEDARRRGAHRRRVRLTPWAACDLELIGTGGYSPLTGFMGREEYEAVLTAMRLPSGLLWTLPVVCPLPEDHARDVTEGEELALVHPQGDTVGLLTVTEVFHRDLQREALLVYGTEDPSHPGVQALLAQPAWAVAGPVWYLRPPQVAFARERLTPRQVREEIRRRGWRTVVGFQTRNPVHRAHEYLHKVALELCDGLLLHPLVGHTKADDIPAAVRMASYRVLLQHYYPPQRVLLAVYPGAMRYAGPREAVHHALTRKNYGCTHFLVGRDHAGVGGYYPPTAAQELTLSLEEEIGLAILPCEHAFYCSVCGQMATARTCPHDRRHHLVLSGTRVRQMLRQGELPPPEFTRPEVARVLAEGWQHEGQDTAGREEEVG